MFHAKVALSNSHDAPQSRKTARLPDLNRYNHQIPKTAFWLPHFQRQNRDTVTWSTREADYAGFSIRQRVVKLDERNRLTP